MPLHAIAALRADSRSIFIDRIKSLLLCKDNLLGGASTTGLAKVCSALWATADQAMRCQSSGANKIMYDSDNQSAGPLAAQLHNHRHGRSSGRLVLVGSLQIVRECIGCEITRRYGQVEILHAATIEAAAALSHEPGDLLIVDASDADSRNAPAFLRAAFPEALIILLMADRITNLGIAERVNLPPTHDALLFLIDAALGSSPARHETWGKKRDAHVPAQVRHEPVDDWSRLTPREREIIAGLLEGKSNKVIASEMELSDNTVKMHLTNIMKKLKVTNRTQIVLLLGHRQSDSGAFDRLQQTIPSERMR